MAGRWRTHAEVLAERDALRSWLAEAHAEIERLNGIVNRGDTLRDHAIRKAMQERDDALTRLAEAEWLLSHAITRETVAEWTRRRDAFLARENERE